MAAPGADGIEAKSPRPMQAALKLRFRLPGRSANRRGLPLLFSPRPIHAVSLFRRPGYNSMANITELDVNGTRRRIDADPGRMLLSVLRDDLDLTGTKYGCGEGQCAACTVLIDGQPVRSCITRVDSAAGKRIVTIEGLAPAGKLHPVQEAFLEADAMQCGWCTPGMILGAVALLEHTPHPSDADIVSGMNGHICRCGTYGRVVRAIQMASKNGGRA